MADADQKEGPDHATVIVAAGMQLRNALVTYVCNMDRKVAFRIAQRLAWEIGDVVSEFWSELDAADMLYVAGDAILNPDRLDAIRKMSLRSPRPADFPDEGMS